jgi:multidrug transporter EmrE-like cation transporter
MTSLLLIEIASRSVAMGSPYVVWGGIGAIGD